MVRYFSLKRNFENPLKISLSEIIIIERITAEHGFPVNIEQVADGVVVYLGDTIAREFFIQLRALMFQYVSIFDADHLPARYWELFDSITGERFYFNSTVDKYMQFFSVLFQPFIKDDRAVDLLSRVRERLLQL